MSASSSAVLVTGATGFVGAHLVRRLVEDGANVHILCREASNFWRLEGVLPRITRHLAPVEDAATIREVFRKVRPGSVYHLAAAAMIAGEGAAGVIPVDLAGTINVLDACVENDVVSVVVTGDSFEYAPSGTPLSEAGCCRPENLHGIAKLGATFHAQALARRRGLPVVVLRLFSTYGPLDNPRRLVPKMIAGALAGTPLLLSRPEIARDWVFVDDIIDLYLEAARRAGDLAGHVFNAGTGVSGSLAELVSTIVRLTGSASGVRWGHFPAPEHDATPWVADMTHTFAHFDWRPRVDLDQGLSRCIEAARHD